MSDVSVVIAYATDSCPVFGSLLVKTVYSRSATSVQDGFESVDVIAYVSALKSTDVVSSVNADVANSNNCPWGLDSVKEVIEIVPSLCPVAVVLSLSYTGLPVLHPVTRNITPAPTCSPLPVMVYDPADSSASSAIL